MLVTICCLLYLATLSLADFDCVCIDGDSSPEPVHLSTDPDSRVIGQLSAPTCKPTVLSAGDTRWLAVALSGQLGFVRNTSSVMVKSCPGIPSPVDIGFQIATDKPMTVNATAPSTSSKSMSTTTAEATTAAATTTTTPTTTPTTTTITTHKSVTSMDVTSHKPPSDFICSPSIVYVTGAVGGFTGVHRKSCYQLVPYPANWAQAETYCVQHGGHLFHVANAADETYVETFLYTHNHLRNVWTGLNDGQHEYGYTWSSGNPVSYTYWQLWHTGVYHDYEDCVVFRAQLYGAWDDVSCGNTNEYICQYRAIHAGDSAPIVG